MCTIPCIVNFLLQIQWTQLIRLTLEPAKTEYYYFYNQMNLMVKWKKPQNLLHI